jgi:hypothetical protein
MGWQSLITKKLGGKEDRILEVAFFADTDFSRKIKLIVLNAHS